MSIRNGRSAGALSAIIAEAQSADPWTSAPGQFSTNVRNNLGQSDGLSPRWRLKTAADIARGMNAIERATEIICLIWPRIFGTRRAPMGIARGTKIVATRRLLR